MSKTDIFRCKDEMPVSGEGVVRATSLPAEDAMHGGLPLPGMRKTSNDVRSARGGMPNPTGRRP